MWRGIASISLLNVCMEYRCIHFGSCFVKGLAALIAVYSSVWLEKTLHSLADSGGSCKTPVVSKAFPWNVSLQSKEKWSSLVSETPFITWAHRKCAKNSHGFNNSKIYQSNKAFSVKYLLLWVGPHCRIANTISCSYSSLSKSVYL